MNHPLYILCLCLFTIRTTICANPFFASLKTYWITPVESFFNAIAKDEAHEETRFTYPNTLGYIKDHLKHGLFKTHVRFIDVEDQPTPLLLAFKIGRYRAGLLIAQEFPSYIDETDTQGNTALHYLAKENALLVGLELIPHRLKKLFGHQLNTPNRAGIPPIFNVSHAHVLLTLHMLGAHLEPEAIKQIRPTHWRVSLIQAVLYQLGFTSRFLATTFDHPEREIVTAHTHLGQTIQNSIHVIARHLCIEQLGHASSNRALTMREQVGRHTKREFIAGRQFAQHNAQLQSGKRSDRPYDEPMHTPQRQRTT